MTKNINPTIKKVVLEKIFRERRLNEKLEQTYNAKRKTRMLIAGTLLVLALGSGATTSFADDRYDYSDYKGVGYVSKVEEVGPKGDGSYISTGKGDAGGISYGLIQLSTTAGSADAFVNENLKNNYPDFYKFFENADKAGTKSFGEAWVNAYNYNPGEFERIQMEYKEQKYVIPSQKAVLEEFGIDLFASRARIEFLHSTSVQFGEEGICELVKNSGVTKDMDDEELLSKLTDEKLKSIGVYKFKKCSSEVQEIVSERFKRELLEYLKIIEEEQGPLLEEEDEIVENENSTEEFVETAKSYLNQGTTYKMGGKNTKQLDCSGYVSLVFQDMGLDVNEFMTNAGKFRNDSVKIDRKDLKEGDLVFWHDKTGTKHAVVYHIGIYIGNDTVIDCSTNHNGVGTRKLSSLQDDNEKYFTFGRYEQLQEKLETIGSTVLDLSNEDEFEDCIEVDEEIESKYEDLNDDFLEDIMESTEKEDSSSEDSNEFDSVIEDTTLDNEIEENENIVLEEVDEFDSVIDDSTLEEVENEDDEDIILEEVKEFDSVVDDTILDESNEENLEDDTLVVEDSDEFDSIIDDSTLEEVENNEDDNEEEDSIIIEDTDEFDSVIEDTTETVEEEEVVEETAETVEEEEVKEETTETVEKEEVVEDTTETVEKEEVKEDTTETVEKEEVVEETTQAVEKEEVKEDTTQTVDEEKVVEETAETVEKEEVNVADARVQELEQKLQNNIFANLFLK